MSYIVTILKCALHLYHWAPWALGIKVIPTFPSSRSDACFFSYAYSPNAQVPDHGQWSFGI